MYFDKYITAKSIKYEEKLHLCKASSYKSYLYGNGEGADNAEKRSASLGFSFDGRVVDVKYYEEGMGALCLENVLEESAEPINLVVAFRGYKAENLVAYGK